MPWKSNVTEAEQKKPVQYEGLHSIALEPHYSVPQVAAMWHVSEKTVRRLFDGEAGVLRWGSSETARKRGYPEPSHSTKCFNPRSSSPPNGLNLSLHQHQLRLAPLWRMWGNRS
jgi:hypothetical protein